MQGNIFKIIPGIFDVVQTIMLLKVINDKKYKNTCLLYSIYYWQCASISKTYTTISNTCLEHYIVIYPFNVPAFKSQLLIFILKYLWNNDEKLWLEYRLQLTQLIFKNMVSVPH